MKITKPKRGVAILLTSEGERPFAAVEEVFEVAGVRGLGVVTVAQPFEHVVVGKQALCKEMVAVARNQGKAFRDV